MWTILNYCRPQLFDVLRLRLELEKIKNLEIYYIIKIELKGHHRSVHPVFTQEATLN